jgi:sulfate adenylyltransferase/3'-phosphoadenosine 5'-phosphosulfate synthase
MAPGFVVWFTGLSGSGKSTLAAMLSAELRASGVHVEVLDGDEVRAHLSKGLTFSREDRDTNVRRIGYVAKLVARSGACAMTAAISPYRNIRDEQRAQIANFVEVYCQCSIPALSARDPKGLYKKALAGEIKHFTGVDDPYEAPESPEVVVHTDAETKEQSLARILARLEELGLITGRATAAHGGLIAPHGGELVNRTIDGSDDPARDLPVIDLDERAESDLSMIASGAFSPLKGFMGSKDYLKVVHAMRLENGLPWPLPITLAASPEATRGLAVGARVALRARGGAIVGTMEIADVWSPDKDVEAREVYGTTDLAHPGIAHLRASGSVYLGGEIQAFARTTGALFPEHHRDPRQTRALFVERGFRRVVGFQTRNPMHRAHEYLTKAALETVDGLLIHPLVGPTREGDVPAAIRMRSYEALIEHYYPRDRVVLSTYPAAMRYAGPREAVFHAITRKNYGCSHFIVGRDHAGFGGFHGPGDARRAFESFSPGEIGIEPLFFEDAFYSTALGEMGTVKTAPGDASTRLAISGTALRASLARGEAPPAELVRPEITAILMDSSPLDSPVEPGDRSCP